MKESQLQSKLFEQVKKYAQTMVLLEQKARAAAVQLQLYTNKANILREKMIKVGFYYEFFLCFFMNLLLKGAETSKGLGSTHC